MSRPAWPLLFLLTAPAWGQMIGNHPAKYAADGSLAPWTAWNDALRREVEWYLRCPVEHGYPRFVWMTFMDGSYNAIQNRPSFIPATQNGLGIISYLKYYDYTGRKDARLLAMARSMGDYLVKESNTPETGKYPRFTRSTGWRERFPQPPDSGSQDDRPYEIEPDKGGIAGYALLLLSEATGERAYLEQALHNARVLAANMGEGDARHSPWPFRADYRTGEGRGDVAGNMSFILRLFDGLMARGHAEFGAPRAALWAWVKNHQIPNASKDGLLWVQFFEDHQEPDNRTAWSPLNMARYLLEARESLDADWKQDARTLIEFVNRRFISVHQGIAVCGEQDYDRNPWGGINSIYGAVLAMYGRATGSREFELPARQALNYTLYAIDDDGCPLDGTFKGKGRGGWQEDAHTDKLHNYVDALRAYPEWGR